MMITTLVLGAAGLLLCLGALVGSSWTVQGMRRHLRRNAAERHDLNEKLRALRHARRCWLCGHRMAYSTCCCHSEPLTESDWVGIGH